MTVDIPGVTGMIIGAATYDCDNKGWQRTLKITTRTGAEYEVILRAEVARGLCFEHEDGRGI